MKYKKGSLKKSRQVKSRMVRRSRSKKVKRFAKSPAMFNIFGVKVYKSDLFQLGGAAGAGALGSVVTQLSGGKLAGNTAQLAGGVALAAVGGKGGKAVAKGVLMKTAGDYIEDNVVPNILGALNMGAPAQANNSAPTEAASQMGYTVI